jgi:sporulation protein YlmC with PRC-barrel domain
LPSGIDGLQGAGRRRRDNGRVIDGESKAPPRHCYDANTDKVGQVTDVIFDPDGRVDVVVIDVGPSLGTGTKNVAVPRSDVTSAPDHVTVNQPKEQLRKAQDYRPSSYSL